MNTRIEFALGVAFLCAVAMIIGFMVKATVFEKKRQRIVVVLDQAIGVEEGHKVLASGMEVGKVAEMELQKDGTVRVVIDLMRDFKLYEGYRVSARYASTLGGRYVDIEVGPPEEEVGISQRKEVPLDKTHRGLAQPMVFEDPNCKGAFTALKEVGATVQRHLEEGDQQGSLGRFFKRRELFDNIEEIRENLRDIEDQMENTEGTVGKFLHDEEFSKDIEQVEDNFGDLQDKFKDIGKDIEAIADDFDKGSLGKFLNDQKLKKSTTRSRENLNAISDQIQEGRGTIGRLVKDDEISRQVDELVEDVRDLDRKIDALTAGSKDGTLAVVFRDEEISSGFRDISDSLDAVVERYKRGEGTVGRLAKDKVIFKELERSARGFSEMLQANEQDLIGTFTNIGFSIFGGGSSFGGGSTLLGQ